MNGPAPSIETASESDAVVAVGIALGHLLLQLADLLLDLALRLLGAALQVLAVIVGRVAEVAAEVSLLLLDRAFDTILQAVPMQLAISPVLLLRMPVRAALSRGLSR